MAQQMCTVQLKVQQEWKDSLEKGYRPHKK